MAIRKRYVPDIVLTGEYAHEVGRKTAQKQNRIQAGEMGMQQQELQQRGDLALLQMQQHAQDRLAGQMDRQSDREYEYASRQQAAQANAEAQQAQDESSQEEIQLRADLEARNAAIASMPPDFSAGPFQAHDVANANNEVLAFPNSKLRDSVLTKAASGDGKAIGMALSRGWMAFSEQDQKRREELQQQLREIQTNPSLRIADRARGEAIVSAELARIQPQIVPSEQQPKTASEQMQQLTGVWTDPTTTGGTWPAQIEVRNGQANVKIIETPAYLAAVEEAKAKVKAKYDTSPTKPAAPTSAREKVKQDPAYRVTIAEKARASVIERIKSEAMAEHAKQSAEIARQNAANPTATPIPTPNPPSTFRQPSEEEIRREAQSLINVADSLADEGQSTSATSSTQQNQQQTDSPSTLLNALKWTAHRLTNGMRSGPSSAGTTSPSLPVSRQQEAAPPIKKPQTGAASASQQQQAMPSADQITPTYIADSLGTIGSVFSRKSAPPRKPTTVLPEPSNDSEAESEAYVSPYLEAADSMNDLVPALKLSKNAETIRQAVATYGWDYAKWPPEVAAEADRAAMMIDGVAAYTAANEKSAETGESVQGDPLPRGSNSEKEFVSKLEIGTVYHVGAKGDEPAYDAVWDGEKFIPIATYKLEEVK